MKIVAVIQSRMESTRLPGKAMADISGKPLTEWIIERAKICRRLDQIVLAIPTEAADDPLAEYFSKSCTVYRGSLADVLDRYWCAAQNAGADVVVRLTGDNPLLEPAIIDEAITQFIQKGVDYGSTSGCPLGIGAEVFTILALDRAHKEATLPYQREHVTPYFYEAPGRFQTASLDVKQRLYGLSKERIRLTVDTLEDLSVVRTIFLKIAPSSANFGLKEISDLYTQDPDLFTRNLHIRQKSFTETERR